MIQVTEKAVQIQGSKGDILGEFGVLSNEIKDAVDEKEALTAALTGLYGDGEDVDAIKELAESGKIQAMVQEAKGDMMDKKVRALIDALMPAVDILLDISKDFDFVGNLPTLTVDPTTSYISFNADNLFLTRNHFDSTEWTFKHRDEETEISTKEEEVD